MVRYFAVLDGESGAFGVSFPDCPGCVAMGKDEDEAYNNAIAALSEWAHDFSENGALPEPRRIEDLRRDLDAADALAEGGAFIAVPLVIESGSPDNTKENGERDGT